MYVSICACVYVCVCLFVYMMEKWRKQNPRSLLLGLQIGAPPIEICVEYSQKLKSKLPHYLAKPINAQRT